jgi:hypothetical protein
MRIVLTIDGVPDIDRENVLHALKCDGWAEDSLAEDELRLYHPLVESEQEARYRLRGIGLNPGELHIERHPDREFSETFAY